MALRVKHAATVVCARLRPRAEPQVLRLDDLQRGADDGTGFTDDRKGHLFGPHTEVTLHNGWELLMGQSEVQNHLKSHFRIAVSDEAGTTGVKLMRYGGEFKFAGGTVDDGEGLEECARRELSEEFLCEVPHTAKLRLYFVMQTRPVQNTSHIMHNFVCLEEENPWLRDLDVGATNHRLQARREAFEAIKLGSAGSGEGSNDPTGRSTMGVRSWEDVPLGERAAVCPEVHQVEWLDMGTALRHAYQSMNSELTFVNAFQEGEFRRLGLVRRDPLFVTMRVMLALERLAGSTNDSHVAHVAAAELRDPAAARKRVQWLWDGMPAVEVEALLADRAFTRKQNAASKDGMAPRENDLTGGSVTRTPG